MDKFFCLNGCGSGSGGSGAVEFDNSTTLGATATSITVSIADTTKNRYTVELTGAYDGTTTRATNLEINGLTTAIHDYQHSRRFSGASISTGQANAATETLVDTNGAVAAGDEFSYILEFTRTAGGWMMRAIGGRNISALSQVTTRTSSFIANDAVLSEVKLLFSTGSFAAGSAVKVWKWSDS